jgi:transposase
MNSPMHFRCSTSFRVCPSGSSGTTATPATPLREHIWDIGARLAIPPQRHEPPVACPDCICNDRNQVERLRARLKEWRAIATRYEKTAVSFMGVLCLAAALDWLEQ